MPHSDEVDPMESPNGCEDLGLEHQWDPFLNGSGDLCLKCHGKREYPKLYQCNCEGKLQHQYGCIYFLGISVEGKVKK